MPSNTIPCSSCSRPLDVHLAPEGEIVCACGAVNDPGAEDAVGDATVDSPPPPESLTVEPLPANFAPPFSRDFLEQYVPMGLLGQGAMGAVYLMRQVRLDRLVAVKVVREDIMTADEARRLEREARTLASLNHPNILQLYDVGLDGRVPYMVCEYVEGETLAKRLGRKPALTLPQTLRIVIQAHQPRNIGRHRNQNLTQAARSRCDFDQLQSMPWHDPLWQILSTIHAINPLESV